jgi:hypothetical protein
MAAGGGHLQSERLSLIRIRLVPLFIRVQRHRREKGRLVGITSPRHSKLRSEANGRRKLATSLGCDIHAAPKLMLAIFRWRRLCLLSRLRFLVLDLRIGNSTFN